MNWDAISAAGEIIGAIAVIGTLFYLARQIKQSNAYAKANAAHETNTLYVQVFSQLAQDAELASIYSRGTKNEPLDEVETIRYGAFLNTYFAVFEDYVQQAEAEFGLSEFAGKTEEIFEFSAPFVRRVVQTNAGKVWWDTIAAYQYSPDFLQLVQKNILDESTNQAVQD